jgi:hypothetical protein
MQRCKDDCTQENGNPQPSDACANAWCDVLAGLGTDKDSSFMGSTGGLEKSSAGCSKSSASSSEKRSRAALMSEVVNALHFGKVDEQEIEKMSPALRSEVCTKLESCLCANVGMRKHTHRGCDRMTTMKSIGRRIELLSPRLWSIVQVSAMLSGLRKRVTQWDIDGPDNIWIVKPGGKSRGRGIHCFNNLLKLRQQVSCSLSLTLFDQSVTGLHRRFLRQVSQS